MGRYEKLNVWRRQPTNQKKNKIFANLEKLFEVNQQIKHTEIEIQLKPGHPPIKQKTRNKPYHLQNYLEKEKNKQFHSGHLEKIQNEEEDCFVSPVIITMKKDKLVEISLDSVKKGQL